MAANTASAVPAVIQLCTLRNVSTMSAEPAGATSTLSGGASSVMTGVPYTSGAAASLSSRIFRSFFT